jgi:hypothetical protein
MKKQPSTPETSPWDDVAPEETTGAVQPPQAETPRPVRPKPQARPEAVEALFDLEGLMNDFPTATDLERFVYDRTGIALQLKGRANKLKYQVAMDVLNGVEVDAAFLGEDNPYIDKTDMIPVEELKPVPARDPSLPDPSEEQNNFLIRTMVHPDTDLRAEGKKVECIFKKYRNGMISYEIIGPIEPRATGEKLDKYGRTRPEIIRMIDPRTGEQVVVRKDGTLTPHGRNLRAMMQKMRVNSSNFWDVWIDREFVTLEGGSLNNPWAVD